jgi:hypothetical protein
MADAGLKQRARRRRREGNSILGFENESGRRRKSDPTPPADDENMPTIRKKRGPNAEIGQALRQAYREAIDETIPPEMLDLLGKLG